MIETISHAGRPGRAGTPLVIRHAAAMTAVLGCAVILLGHEREVLVVVTAILGSCAFLALFRRHPTSVAIGVWLVAVTETTVAAMAPRGLANVIETTDEPLILLLLVGTLLFRMGTRSKERYYIYVPMAGFLVAGLLSGVLNSVPLAPTVLGAWQANKVWTLLFVVVHLPWRRRDVALLVKAFAITTVAVMAVATIELLVPSLYRAVVPVPFDIGERLGRTSLRSFLGHPSHFGSFSAVSTVFFLARFVYTGRRRDLMLALWCAGLGLLSLRFKVLMGLAGALATLAFASPGRFFRRIGAGVLVALAALSLAGGILTDLAEQQIQRYVVSDSITPREALYFTSGEIGRDNFPFGEGFGRFGTGAATQFDSPVYDEYGLGDRKGLSQEEPGFRHDTSWPTILGESGWAGALFFFGGFAAIWVRLLRSARRSEDRRAAGMSLAALTVLSNVLLESLGRPTFFHPTTSMTIALMVGAALSYTSRRATSRLVYRPMVSAG